MVSQKPKEIKRSTKVRTNHHGLTDSFKKLVTAFGFNWHVVSRVTPSLELEGRSHLKSIFDQAAGEAEAELAQLNKNGYLDAVLTDDSDTFIFGARVIIRKCVQVAFTRLIIYRNTSPNVHADKDNISIIKQPDPRLTSQSNGGLSSGGLLLMALLCGGDYDEVRAAQC